MLRTNELENAIDYLNRLRFTSITEKTVMLMISLHGTLYGFGICAIKGTNKDRVLDNKMKKSKFEQKKKELYEFYKQEYGMELDAEILELTAKYNTSKLLGIYDVIEYCQDESYMTQNMDSRILNITDQQVKAIGKMIDYRNDFVHIKPKGISVIIESEEWIIKEVVDVIEFLALESGNVYYFDQGNSDKVKQLLEKF
jgi:hypothetical protein